MSLLRHEFVASSPFLLRSGAAERMGEYVLYVGYDRSDRSRFCHGSRRAIEIVDRAGVQDRVTVQSVDALRESMGALPTWLSGTPTLVSRATRKAMRGTAAVEHLQELVASGAEEGGEAAAAPGEIQGLVAAGEAMHLGTEQNFEPLPKDDPDKYDDSRKITDADLQRLLDRRKATVPPA